MTQDFSNKVVLITGGGSGFGQASALLFAKQGAKVSVADIDQQGGQTTVHMIEEGGGEAVFIQTDVSKASEVEAMVSTTVDTLGGLDIAFNNAGILGAIAPLSEYSEEDWNRVTGVHLTGVFHCLKYELRHMLKTGAGAIVNTASVMGLVGTSGGACAYVASKHGIIGLTKAAALECAKSGIRVNAVCPAYFKTPMLDELINGNAELEAIVTNRQPMKRLGMPTEVAEAVVWLCSDAASFITGHALPVDGGYLAQ